MQWTIYIYIITPPEGSESQGISTKEAFFLGSLTPIQCGEPIEEGDTEDKITQTPWMVALGVYKEEDAIKVNPSTGVRFLDEDLKGPCIQAG